MFNFDEKMKYINGEKVYTKRGKENCYPIGKIVKIDWAIQSEYCSGINAVEELDKKLQNWLAKCDSFVVTDVFHWGISSTITLDHRFTVSVFRAYEADSKRYVSMCENVNSGVYREPLAVILKQPYISTHKS